MHANEDGKQKKLNCDHYSSLVIKNHYKAQCPQFRQIIGSKPLFI